MSTIITIVIFVVIFVAVVYYKQARATRRAQRALGRDNLFIYPAKEHDMYIIRDNVSKDILSIAKDLDNGEREYLMFYDVKDRDRVASIVIDNKDGVLSLCYVDENGNLYCAIENKYKELEEHMDFREYAELLEDNGYSECHGNIQDHEWFHSKTGDLYQIQRHHLDIPPRP